MTQERQFIKRLAAVLLLAVFLWVVLKYFLGAIAPFLLAWLTASLSEPVIVQMAEKCKIKRGYASGLCSLVVLLSVVGIAALLASRAYWELASIAEHLPEKLAFLPGLLERLRSAAEGLIRSSPPQLREYLNAVQQGVAEKAALLPGEISARLLETLTHAAAKLPSVVLFTATYAVSVFFISASYPNIISFFLCQLPDSWRSRVKEAAKAMRCGFGKWFRAQLTMSGVMFGLLLLVFVFVGVSSPLVLAGFTALVDALPILGVGTVLIPWAAWEFFGGSGGRGALLAALWLLCMGLRSFLEPRLVGSQSGVNPAAALLAAYCGWRAMGVGGLVLLPLLLVMIKEMNDSGVVRLWVTPGCDRN